MTVFAPPSKKPSYRQGVPALMNALANLPEAFRQAARPPGYEPRKADQPRRDPGSASVGTARYLVIGEPRMNTVAAWPSTR